MEFIRHLDVSEPFHFFAVPKNEENHIKREKDLIALPIDDLKRSLKNIEKSQKFNDKNNIELLTAATLLDDYDSSWDHNDTTITTTTIIVITTLVLFFCTWFVIWKINNKLNILLKTKDCKNSPTPKTQNTTEEYRNNPMIMTACAETVANTETESAKTKFMPADRRQERSLITT